MSEEAERLISLDWVDVVEITKAIELTKDGKSEWENIEVWTKKLPTLEELKEVEEKVIQTLGPGRYYLGMRRRILTLETKYRVWFRVPFDNREVLNLQAEYWLSKIKEQQEVEL